MSLDEKLQVEKSGVGTIPQSLGHDEVHPCTPPQETGVCDASHQLFPPPNN